MASPFTIQMIRRRAVVAGFAAIAFAGVRCGARAQQPERVRRVGVLVALPENNRSAQASVAAFSRALRQLGWVEGENIRIDYRFAADPTLLKRYAAELIANAPEAIMASTTPAAATLRERTRTIPIIFVNVLDPVGQGFVQSLARPGGNIT